MVFPACLLPLENYSRSLPLKYHYSQLAKEVCFDHALCSCLSSCFEGLVIVIITVLGVPSFMIIIICESFMFSNSFEIKSLRKQGVPPNLRFILKVVFECMVCLKKGLQNSWLALSIKYSFIGQVVLLSSLFREIKFSFFECNGMSIEFYAVHLLEEIGRSPNPLSH